MTRDWTPTDAADAADAERDRNWWRRNPYAEPDYPDESEDDGPLNADESSREANK